MGGITPDDEELLVRLSLSSRMPVVIQGLGARSKVDAPTAGWDNAKRFVDEATDQGAAVFSLAMSKPFNRTFDLATGTTHVRRRAGVQSHVHRRARCRRRAWRCCATRRSATPSAIRSRTPTAIPARAPTLPPPHWDVVHVNKVSELREREVRRPRLTDVAAELGVHPTDAMIDIALSEDLTIEFLWRTETQEWIDGTRVAQADPHMLVGTSDGGAHLDRDDGAEAHSVLPEALGPRVAGLHARRRCAPDHCDPGGAVRHHRSRCPAAGLRADVYIFDPDTIGPAQKEFVHDFPNGAGRWTSKPEGVYATIVNGEPIVLDGELQPTPACPVRSYARTRGDVAGSV